MSSPTDTKKLLVSKVTSDLQLWMENRKLEFLNHLREIEQSRIQQLETDFERKSKSYIEQLENRMHHLQSFKKSLDTQFSELKEQKTMLEASARSMKDSTKEQKRMFIIEKKKLESLHDEELQNMEKTHQNTINSMKTKLSTQDSQMQYLKEELEEGKTETLRIRTEYNRYKQDVGNLDVYKLKLENDNLVSQLNQLSMNLEEEKNAHRVTKSQLMRSVDMLNRLKSVPLNFENKLDG
ncbi:hypothetical protein PCE1_001174 [Barthelona sp. PCE]